jgi:hypothetical protein
LESRPVAKRFIPVINLGYDGYHEKMGCGLGMSISILEKVSLLGEYFPVLDSDQDEREDSFAFGFRIRTYGHFFLFLLGNNVEIGTRQLMRGAVNNELHFGFNIQRLIEL